MRDAFAVVSRRNWSAAAIKTKFTDIRAKTKKKDLRRKSLLTSTAISDFLELLATFSSKYPESLLLVCGLLNLDGAES